MPLVVPKVEPNKISAEDATYYSITITRTNREGYSEYFQFSGYGNLQKLLVDLETKANDPCWFAPNRG